MSANIYDARLQDTPICLHSLFGICSMHCSRLWHPASPYLIHPWTRTSYIPVVVREVILI